MQYNIYIQNKFYKRISASYISDIIRYISADIQNNIIPDFDNTKEANIKIVPVS